MGRTRWEERLYRRNSFARGHLAVRAIVDLTRLHEKIPQGFVSLDLRGLLFRLARRAVRLRDVARLALRRRFFFAPRNRLICVAIGALFPGGCTLARTRGAFRPASHGRGAHTDRVWSGAIPDAPVRRFPAPAFFFCKLRHVSRNRRTLLPLVFCY